MVQQIAPPVNLLFPLGQGQNLGSGPPTPSWGQSEPWSTDPQGLVQI